MPFAVALVAQAGAGGPSLAILQQRVARNPKNQEALYDLGRRYLALSQEMLDRAHEIDPDSALSHVLQGEIAEGTGNLKQAQEEYEAAIARAPSRAEGHEHLGSVLWLQGLWSAASLHLEEALRLSPGNCRVQWKQGDVLLNQQDAAKALPLLEASVAGCPRLDQARVDRARALIELNRAPEALDDLLLAAKHTPDEPSIHFLLNKVYRARGEMVQAKREMLAFQQLSSARGTTPQ